ncbi:MAG: ABC transporter permease [Candidatus Acidiferrales bacterium]
MESRFIYWRLVWNNLGVRPLRSTLSVAAMSLQVLLILFVVGLTSGMLSYWRTQQQGVGADIIVQPPNSSIFIPFSSAVMPQSLGEKIARLPGVKDVAPVVVVMAVGGANVVMIDGIDYDRYASLSQGFKFLSGGPFTAPNQVIADDLMAHSKHLKVGSVVDLVNHQFVVCGIVLHGKGARFFIPLATAQYIQSAEGRASMFYVLSDGHTDAVRAEIVKITPDSKVQSIADYLSLVTSTNLPGIDPFVHTFVGLGVAISFLVVLLTMHTLVLERTREIGILKALGFSKIEVCGLIAVEALVMAGLAVVFGLIFTGSLLELLRHTAPTLSILIEPIWVLRAVGLTILGAMAGGLYPALRAAASDPVDALAYE